MDGVVICGCGNKSCLELGPWASQDIANLEDQEGSCCKFSTKAFSVLLPCIHYLNLTIYRELSSSNSMPKTRTLLPRDVSHFPDLSDASSICWRDLSVFRSTCLRTCHFRCPSEVDRDPSLGPSDESSRPASYPYTSGTQAHLVPDFRY